MPNAEKPLYVDYGGQQVFRAPIELSGVRFYSFMLDADADALRRLCDQRLNAPSNGKVEYHPLVPRVLLGCADIGRACCVDSPDAARGWMQEIDVAFWVPVAAVRREGGVYLAERIAWFLPYVFVNNSIAVATGREVYGFPKAPAEFQVPRGPDDAARVTVDTLVVERYGPEPSQAQVKRLLEVQRVDGGPVGGLAAAWNSAEEAFKAFLHLFAGTGGKVTLPGLGLLVQVFQFLLHHEVPLVFLKQFRDAADGSRACYQAVVEAPAKLLKFHGGGPLAGKYRLAVNSYASHPIVQELGLSGAEQDVAGAWYTEFDFTMESGREVWNSADTASPRRSEA